MTGICFKKNYVVRLDEGQQWFPYPLTFIVLGTTGKVYC